MTHCSLCHPLYLSVCSFFCLYLRTHSSTGFPLCRSVCSDQMWKTCSFLSLFKSCCCVCRSSCRHQRGLRGCDTSTRGCYSSTHSREFGFAVYWGGLCRNKHRSGLHASVIIQIILCVILKPFQDQNDTVVILLYISEGCAVINTDVGRTSDDYI